MSKLVVCGKVKDDEADELLRSVYTHIPGAVKGSRTGDGMRRISAPQSSANQMRDYLSQWNDRESGLLPKYIGPPRWMYAITTVPSRKDLFDRTMASLVKAGFGSPIIFVDSPHSDLYGNYKLPTVFRESNIRTYGHWLLTLLELYIRDPYATRFAIFQDDIVLCKNLRSYLDNSTYPQNGYCNLFTFMGNEDKWPNKLEHGWRQTNQNGYGGVALVFSNEAVVALMSQSSLLKRLWNPELRYRALDGGVVEAMRRAGWKEYCHNPSLVQHTGIKSSMGNHWQKIDVDVRDTKRYPQSPIFPGEEFDACQLIKLTDHVS